jgi:hypothetical protein
VRERALLDLGVSFREFGGLTPRELWLRYERQRKLEERQMDIMVVQAWWSGLFARAAFHAEEYPRNVEDFLPSLAEERARRAREELESWTLADCYRAVGLNDDGTAR